jgi:hypothetical protein
VDYIAAGVMVALGALVGKRIGIHPKRNDDWLVIPNLWGAIIAPPSKRKTPQLQEALRFLNTIDAGAREVHQIEMEAFSTTKQYNEMVMAAAKEQAKKEIKKGNHKVAKQHMEDAAAEIEPAPVRQRYIFNDSTIEKLMEIQQENPMGLLLFRDELSGWMASLDREDRRSDRAYVLEGWPGNQSSSYDRVGRGSGHVNSNTLSVLGGIQPGKVQPYLKAMIDGHGDDGLMQRFQLLVYPDSTRPVAVDEKPNLAAREKVKTVFDNLARIPAHDGTEPLRVRFTDSAQEDFTLWYDRLLQKIHEEPSSHIASHLAKYPSLMPSIALLTHLADAAADGVPTLDDLLVDDIAAARAMAWCGYLETHARRVYARGIDPLAGAKILASRLDKLDSPFRARDVHRKKWIGLGDIDSVEYAVAVLVANHYLISREVETGGRPTTDYHINPEALGLIEDEDDETK